MLSSLALLLCAHAAGEPFTAAVPTLPDRSHLYLQYNPDFQLVFVVPNCDSETLVVSSEIYSRSHHNSIKKSGKGESSDCLYEGLWYAAGASVRTREVCLACVCAQGALSCRRRSCAPQPDPPSRCHVVHRRGDCCPELQCPDGVRYLDQTASGRFDDSNIEMPSSIGHACVEGGTIYAAGSAMSSNIACEQCFCLGGLRRCVRPRCLPPPPGCTARPTSGACCPQRYYCEHGISKPQNEKKTHDCITPKGNWVNEGSRVKDSEIGSKCIQCFCLHGSIRCQYLSCAPSLHGCKPIVQPGQCCAHQYTCDHHINETKSQNLIQQRQNTLLSLKEEARSFHTSKSTKRETTTKEILTAVTDKTMPAITVTKEEPIKPTTKVKRKTDDIQVVLDKADTTRMMTVQTTNDFTTTTIETTTEMLIEKSFQELTTEQPEGSVRIIINGTINCTSELSSSSLLLNVTDINDTMWSRNETQQQQRIPLIDKYDNLENTFFSNDIITEGSYNANFDEDETFNVNVTTSLKANNTRIVTPTTVPKIVLFNNVNTSKVKKGEYDYDYTEPTLPPSLPNLKIIPFVAADAVVDDEISSKEMPNYPVLEKEDKFPIYYPTKDPKETIFSMRKEHIYNNTHYSLYSPEIESKHEPQYPGTIEDESTVNIGYPSITNDVPDAPDVHEYTVTASFGNPAKFNSIIKSESNSASKFEMENPAVNLFSPPAETEGGFVPKDPELMEDFYSGYQSTSSRPHLTTSMQLETKDVCVSSDGRRIREGESISLACSLCSCAWGELHCSPLPCLTPPGCKRLTASKNTPDSCCGELLCDYKNKTTKPSVLPSDVKISLNETKVSFSFEDKERLNVTRQNNKSYGSDLTYNNESVRGNVAPGNLSSIVNATSQNTVNDSPAKSTITEATSTTPTTEKFKAISNHSLEYEDDDDADDEDDEGFSLGSVLKLLLSETYESTTIAPSKQKSTTIPHTSKAVITTLASTTSRKPTTISEKFIPVTHRYPYILHKYPNHQFNTVDRIDHLVLGEASAIRKTSTQPAATFKPVTFTTTRRTTTAKTTQRPISTNSIEITSKEGFINQLGEIRPPSNFLSGFGLGLPKLAGCNIYGRMYRVGRIIAELSSPCQECKCTELGVQCRSLGC